MRTLFCLVPISVIAMAGAAAGATPSPDVTTTVIASTVPSNGDVNPYGVAVEPTTVGNLTAGHILVSNFNNSANLQGTGTTIVDIAPTGAVTLFAQIDAGSLPGSCPGGVGLTTALVALQAGWVIVGSLPTSDGTSATAQAGCLIVLSPWGTPVSTIASAWINGPWDMTVQDLGSTANLFVTNVLNGTVAGGGSVVPGGTVVRLGLTLTDGVVVSTTTVIGDSFSERTDPAALVIGPTGMALAPSGILYVADSLNNRIAAIPNAATTDTSCGTCTTVAEGGLFNDPLGVTISPSGDIVTVNGNNGLAFVISPNGRTLLRALLDNNGRPPGAGALFGLAFGAAGLYYVDDATNTLNLATQ